jgi:hypothetical protein
MNRHIHNNGILLRKLVSVAALAFFSSAALGANKITGFVRNETRGEPAAGDEVILLRLDKIVQEEGRTRTGAEGAFTLDAQYPDKPYLVRVLHQGVSYDQRALAGGALTIQVFDAAPQVSSVTGTIEILRAATKGDLLHVSDMSEIENKSSPPMTQASADTFDAYLPSSAKIDSVLAAAPGKIAEVISVAAVPGEPGHYVVSFPLRPGATKLAFNYDLPYRGRASFSTKRTYPLQQFAVMIPRTMKFGSRSRDFVALATGSSDYQVRAITQVGAGAGPSFEVSGTGALPPIRGEGKTQQTRTQDPTTLLSSNSSVSGRAPSTSSQRIPSNLTTPQSPSQSLVLSVVTAILLAACVVLIWRTRKARRITAL